MYIFIFSTFLRDVLWVQNEKDPDEFSSGSFVYLNFAIQANLPRAHLF